jgi:hypothetical protein
LESIQYSRQIDVKFKSRKLFAGFSVESERVKVVDLLNEEMRWQFSTVHDKLMIVRAVVSVMSTVAKITE